jgi:TonB-dependent starch-binding outer membrane protein SusC
MRKLLLLCLVLLSSLTILSGQGRTVSGKITSGEDGSPLPGVNVLVKGTTTGTISDTDGNYSISVTDGDAILQFSFIGFVTQEISASGKSIVNVVLESDTKQLTEVIVTGYREENKRALTGTINTVTAKSIQDVPVASIDQILQGRAPGVLVLGGSGQPGSAANVTIRGRGSIAAGTDPLYVLDGVPIDPQSFNSLNSNDYDVVSILTDASATSIYGSRAANGVILLNSKKGKSGKTRFSYNSQYGVANPPENKLELMNSNQKIDYELERGTNLTALTAEEIADLRQINTDWADVLFQNGKFQSHELTAQGGNNNTTFFVSGSYLSQEGTIKTTLLERYTTRFNLSHESGSFRFSMNSTIGYSKNSNTREGDAFIGSPLNAVRWANPYEKPYDDNGEFTAIRTGQPNPLQELLGNTNDRRDLKMVGSINMAYDLPIKGLTIRTLLGADFDQSDGTAYLDRTTYQGTQATGQQGAYGRGFGFETRLINTNSINYSTAFGEDHNLSVGLFQETNFRQLKNFNFTGFGLTGNLKNENGITVSNTFLPVLGGNNSESGLSSYFTDVRYGFKDRYHVSLGLRRDASSRFGTGNKNANFFSVGANWIISDESFFSGLSKTFNLLKLNASFGTSGNQDIGDFQSKELYSSAAGFSYDGSSGVRLVQLENPNLKWETQKMFDISLEFGLLNNRISGKVGYYNRLTSDLLFNTPLSRTTGFTSIVQNVGSLRNNGIEFSISADVVKTNNFVWNVSGNFTNNVNEVVEIYGSETKLPTGFTVLEKGKPFGTNYMVEYAGVNPANGDALYKKLDGTITNAFSSADLRTHGTRFAPRFGGFTNTLSYKGVELSAFFTWVQGNEIYNNDRTNVENPTYLVDQMATSNLRAWKQPGDITDVPRQSTVDGLTTADYQAQTTRYLEDGSFLRLRNVLLSYTLPSAWLTKIKVSSLRVFAQGQNVFTHTKFLGWDPELAAGTLVGAQYPALRTITFGVNLGL